jgi:hypothetical protein
MAGIAEGKQWNGNVNQWNRILIQWNKIVNQWIRNVNQWIGNAKPKNKKPKIKHNERRTRIQSPPHEEVGAGADV